MKVFHMNDVVMQFSVGDEVEALWESGGNVEFQVTATSLTRVGCQMLQALLRSLRAVCVRSPPLRIRRGLCVSNIPTAGCDGSAACKCHAGLLQMHHQCGGRREGDVQRHVRGQIDRYQRARGGRASNRWRCRAERRLPRTNPERQRCTARRQAGQRPPSPSEPATSERWQWWPWAPRRWAPGWARLRADRSGQPGLSLGGALHGRYTRFCRCHRRGWRERGREPTAAPAAPTPWLQGQHSSRSSSSSDGPGVAGRSARRRPARGPALPACAGWGEARTLPQSGDQRPLHLRRAWGRQVGAANGAPIAAGTPVPQRRQGLSVASRTRSARGKPEPVARSGHL